MDITTLFKACVKTVRIRNKALGVTHSENDKNRILSNTQARKNNFSNKAKEIVAQITRLRDFLLEHRKAYLSISGYLLDEPQLSDAERDKIDLGAQRIMKTCSSLIHDFRRQAVEGEIPMQTLQHQDSVIDLLEAYLKTVCQIYSEQRMIRMKRMMDTQKMSRLDSGKDATSDKITNRENAVSEAWLLVSTGKSEVAGQESDTVNDRNGVQQEKKCLDESSLSAARSAALADLAAPFAVSDDQISAEELQMFESENAILYNELNSLSDEVQQIERRVVKIAELQDVFTQKVLQQEVDVERISSIVVGATENVRDANSQIRQAIQRNAGLRVYVLFFLLVMSFSLLFLDWYND